MALKFFGQVTVGIGGNLLWWHHPYIIPDPKLQTCHSYNYANKEEIKSNKNKESIAISEQQRNKRIKECQAYKQKNIKIPKIIHQTYKSLKEIPEHWKTGAKLWKTLHPDWEYRFWSDTDLLQFMKDEYPWFVPFYMAYPHHIQRVDVARYFLLHHFGGVYSDLDISPRQNIEPLLSNIDVMIVETPNVGATNSLMAAAKNSPFFFFIMDKLSEYYNTGWYLSFAPSHLRILLSTGPTAFWALYSRYSAAHGQESIGILHSRQFGRLSVCNPDPGNIPQFSEDSEILHVMENMQAMNRNGSVSSSVVDENVVVGIDILPISTSSATVDGVVPSLMLFSCRSKAFEMHSFFYHVSGNSWHNGSSWYVNWFFACHPITSVFFLYLVGWASYHLLCIGQLNCCRDYFPNFYLGHYFREKEKKDSCEKGFGEVEIFDIQEYRKTWLRNNAFYVLGCMGCIILLFIFPGVVQYLRKFNC